MGFNEFKELSNVLNGWKNTFASYDRDRSGTMEGHELQVAINNMGRGQLVKYCTHCTLFLLNVCKHTWESF